VFFFEGRYLDRDFSSLEDADDDFPWPSEFWFVTDGVSWVGKSSSIEDSDTSLFIGFIPGLIDL